MAFCVLLVITYVYLIKDTVNSIVLRRETIATINEIESELATLESQYVTQNGTISIDFAYSLGYRDAGRFGTFAYTSVRRGLSLNE